ncbi:MAG: hypothetical protein ABL977_14530, partial [Candidatus Eisenbacteria bacterium]
MQRAAGLDERELHPAGQERVLAGDAGAGVGIAHVGAVVVRIRQPAVPGARRHERAVVPQRERREALDGGAAHTARYATHRAAELGGLELQALQRARHHERRHMQPQRTAFEESPAGEQRGMALDQPVFAFHHPTLAAEAPARPRLVGERLEQRQRAGTYGDRGRARAT